MSNQSLVRIAKTVGKWIPALLLVLIFAPQGYSKFSDTSGWAKAFRTWGYPDWFRITIGAVEVLAVALLLWARTAAIGAILIICVMLGAWGTHLVFENGRHMTSEVVPLVLASIVVLVRRKEVLELFRATAHEPV